MNTSFEIHRDTITKLAHKNKSYRGLAAIGLNSNDSDKDKQKKKGKRIILPMVSRDYKKRERKVFHDSKPRMMSVDSSISSFEKMST